MAPFIADLHVHSHFSRATSRELTPEHLDLWARLKGIALVGTGDLTHPGWLKELEEKLEPSAAGLFRLREGLRLAPPLELPWAGGRRADFLLSGEISTIYKKGERVRRVHHLLLAPGFEAAAAIQRSLASRRANITSDGRPILGMDSRDLLELVLEASRGEALFIPAHIWTPWFSVLGDRGGFDSIEECYGDLSPHIHALETGLSSDPPMNWLCRRLDRFALVSNSDAHSPERVGREATLFAGEPSFPAVASALGEGAIVGTVCDSKVVGTLEFFPQEGKYHYDGHRKCGVRWSPEETRKHQGICPQCGKPLTVGVLHRVTDLADREPGEERPGAVPFHSHIPLRELLAEILDSRPESRKVEALYFQVLRRLGPELEVLCSADLERVERECGPELALALRRMRARDVTFLEGYDGEYGRIRVFREGELERLAGQGRLFSLPESAAPVPRKRVKPKAKKEEPTPPVEEEPLPPAVDREQEAAIAHGKGPALVVAGPGSGKTRVLVGRIVHLVKSGQARPEGILALTFTNRAAREMRERTAALLGADVKERMQIGTFHSFGLGLLREHAKACGRTPRFSLLDEEQRLRLLRAKGFVAAEGQASVASAARLAQRISWLKQNLVLPAGAEEGVGEAYGRYEEVLRDLDAFDVDDLVSACCGLLAQDPDLAASLGERFSSVLVDECQDLNEAQYQLLRRIKPGRGADLFLVGDPRQAIYGFRGADLRLLERFRTDYSPALFRLQRSYRCTQSILSASAGVLPAGDEQRLEGLAPGVKVREVSCSTDRSEAEFVARTIEGMMGGVSYFSMDSGMAGGERAAGIESFADFAVLCRTQEQFGAHQEAFANHGISCQAAGEKPFTQEEPARTILDLLRLYQRPDDRVLPLLLPEQGKLSSEARAELEARPSVAEKVGFLAGFLGSSADPEKAALGERLARLASAFGDDLSAFLQETSLNRAGDALHPRLEGVALLTLHAGKGLEFGCVFVTGCEQGLLPFALFPERAADAEEEKRLLFVGMTRAKRYLFLTRADRRRLYGREWSLARSPFLEGVAPGLIAAGCAGRQESAKKRGPVQRKLFDLEPGEPGSDRKKPKIN